MSPTSLPPAEPEQSTGVASELRRLSREPVIWFCIFLLGLAGWVLTIAATSIVI